MEVLYIESKLKNFEVNIPKSEISKLPKKIFLLYTIQYKSFIEKIKKILEKEKIKIQGVQQVLGCSEIKTKYPLFLISSGKFHATNLFLYSNEIYIFEGNKIRKIPKQEIEKVRIKRKSAYIRFLKADKIGILVSTKPGQENLKKAETLKQKLKKQGKKAYIFISNNIDISQFENFKIDSWVNTACPGLAMDNPKIINIKELFKK